MRYTSCRNVNNENKGSIRAPYKIYLVASFSHAEFILISQNTFTLKPMSSLVSRRFFLTSTALAAATGAIAQSAAAAKEHSVFQHGVASGDPLAGRALLETPMTVQWEVSDSAEFSHAVATGNGVAFPNQDMTVKVDATGLLPQTTNLYRFSVVDGPYSGHCSAAGKASTIPGNNQAVSHLRFAFFRAPHGMPRLMCTSRLPMRRVLGLVLGLTFSIRGGKLRMRHTWHGCPCAPRSIPKAHPTSQTSYK